MGDNSVDLPDLNGLDLGDVGSQDVGGSLANVDFSALGISQADLTALAAGLPNLGTTPGIMPIDPHNSPVSAPASTGLVPVGMGTGLVVKSKGTALMARVAAGLIGAVGLNGMVTVAKALGLDATKLLAAWVGRKGKKRRARGVTGRQLANARRTVRVVTGMYHKLEKSFPHRRAPAPGRFGNGKHKK